MLSCVDAGIHRLGWYEVPRYQTSGDGMDETTARRAELADFLRGKREQAEQPPRRFGGLGRRRRPGLRRKEIAQLIGVSVTWYAWLEDGRDVRPNPQVLDALARVLRLSADEHTELCTLAEAARRTRYHRCGTSRCDHSELTRPVRANDG